MIRTFASALRGVEDYIFGPDMGTNESCMACVRDEIGRCVGLPREFGGIPLDELGATAWGLMHAADVATAHAGRDLKNARFVIQGFGAVGKHAARFLAQKGAIMVAAADSRGAIFDAEGLDVTEITKIKEQGGSIIDHGHGQRLRRDEVVEVDCDILVPAARPDVIHEGNIDRIKAKFIVPGANIPATPEAEAQLRERGIVSVPDFIANAGGVICAALEYAGSPEALVFPTIEEKVRRNTAAVLEQASRRGVDTRVAALDLARTRVLKAMQYRRHGVFSAAPHNL
jgi:glutamate dehydrogenase (NAD(P)+)